VQDVGQVLVFNQFPITKEADPEIALRIVERSDQYPGVSATPSFNTKLSGNAGVNGAHLLGYVGPLTDAI
jgi:penicillin-binding protein 2